MPGGPELTDHKYLKFVFKCIHLCGNLIKDLPPQNKLLVENNKVTNSIFLEKELS